MKFIRILLVTVFAVLFAQYTIAGPFGLSMGMTIKDIDSKAQKVAPNVYLTKEVPKPHSAFDEYVVKIGPKNGLCWIKAIGADISTSSYGIELKSAFDEMAGKLKKAYGKGEITGMLLPGSIWDAPNEFMMAMIKQERFLMAIWQKEKGSKLEDGLSEIGLIASASGRENGYLSLEYSFSNKEACNKEIDELEDDAL